MDYSPRVNMDHQMGLVWGIELCVRTTTMLILLLGSVMSNSVWSASIPERITFQNILENKDITLGEVTAFLQDSQGFIWFGGSNSLIRYDGYEFRPIEIWSDDPKINRLVPITSVQHLYEDTQHNIWIAARGGVLKFDPIKESVIKITDTPKQSPKISDSTIRRIFQLPSGEILGCGFVGLFVIDPKTETYTTIVPDSKKSQWLQSRRVNTGYVDPSGIVWLGTEVGLERLDWSTKTFRLYSLDSLHPDAISGNRVSDIVPAGDQKFWLATSNGLVSFDIGADQRTRYTHSPADSSSIGGNDIWDLHLDTNGVLWIASDGGGLSTFNPADQRFVNHRHEPGRVGSINTNQVRAIFQDANGDMWAGNYPTGINFFDRTSAAIQSYTRDVSDPNSLSYNAVQSLLEDEQGNLWVGTDGGGLNYFDRTTGKFTHYTSDSNNPESLNGNAILTLTKDSEGLIWVGTWDGGVASFNAETMKFTRYPFDSQRNSVESVSLSPRLNGASVWSIKEDRYGYLWIGTHNGGLSKFDRNTSQFTNYGGALGPPMGLSSLLVWTTLEDSAGQFWVGTNNGLSLMDREQQTFKTYNVDARTPNSLSNSAAHTLYEDSKKRLWVGTDAGLNLFDPETNSFMVYDKATGFTDEIVRTIVEDADGILWLSTDNGFSSFHPETLEINNYSRINGRLIGGFATHAGIVSHKGEIIFGGNNGLRIINPKELSKNRRPPPIVLTDFKVFADSVEVGAEDGILKRSINLTQELALDYKTSMIAFSFSALNYRDSVKNRYAYRLEGFDPEWLDVGDQRTAKYTNLKPGKYVFRVKGSNNDGVWNEEGKTITIIQLTPPWQSWWAYTLYALTALGVLVLVLNHQRRKRKEVENHNRLLEMKVAERTAEVTARTAEVLEKSKNIQIMLTNIPQGLFTVLSDGTIHPEYSEYLESIFETKVIAGRNASDLLFNRANLVGDALALAKSAIFAIIGEDQINFDINRALLLTEYEIHFDGHKKYLSLDWSPILDDDIVNRLMVSVRDVTHLKHMETNLIQAEKLAALGALVAGVAHELNTPIGNGLTVASTLCESCADIKKAMKRGLTRSALDQFIADVDEGAQLVNRNLMRASELVSSFKQVAVDRTSAQRRKFLLQDMIQEICFTASPIFKFTPYILDVVVRDDVIMDSYPGPLGQVITNLLNNTVIHAFDGRDHGRVVVAAENVVNGVNISVTDDGVGISVENQAKIFDPFFTTKLGLGGNGLGMHIVHNIVTGVLGGTIHFTSTVGQGTCFIVSLPKVAPLVAVAEDEELRY
jgi:ligand-binding sensor domain-containing protein/signal transduction histidine kinase